MTKKSLIPQFFARDVFKDFDKFFMDFDSQVAKMQKFHDDMTKNIPNYPPFNVRKHDDTHYTIEIAVAGFGEQEIEVEMDDGNLSVKACSNADETNDYLIRGIGGRKFTRVWALGNEYKVEGAELFNGILKIALERFIPEAQKATKVPIKTKGVKQFLND